MPEWPYSLAKVITDGYSTTQANNVRRTDFDDGAIQQRRLNSRSMKIREFQIVVKQSDLPAFRSWMRDNGHDFFDFRDIDDSVERPCRIRQGAGSVSFVRADDFHDGERYYRADIVLEGFE